MFCNLLEIYFQGHRSPSGFLPGSARLVPTSSPVLLPIFLHILKQSSCFLPCNLGKLPSVICTDEPDHLSGLILSHSRALGASPDLALVFQLSALPVKIWTKDDPYLFKTESRESYIKMGKYKVKIRKYKVAFRTEDSGKFHLAWMPQTNQLIISVTSPWSINSLSYPTPSTDFSRASGALVDGRSPHFLVLKLNF